MITDSGLLIGTRTINGIFVEMFQVGARVIEVRFNGNSRRFIGNADNAHIDEIWDVVLRNGIDKS